MRNSNRESIDYFGDDDMPCPCEECHEWFDLNDGKDHPRKKNLIICASCSDKIQADVDREEEIEELRNEIHDAECTIENAKDRLRQLGAEI